MTVFEQMLRIRWRRDSPSLKQKVAEEKIEVMQEAISVLETEVVYLLWVPLLPILHTMLNLSTCHGAVIQQWVSELS